MNIYDIAKKANVSIATVSRVINNSPKVSKKTREKVLAVIDNSSYAPSAIAQNLSMQNSLQNIGIICYNFEDLYYARAVSLLEKPLREKGYNIILVTTGDDAEQKAKSMGLLESKQVDALILIGSVFVSDKEDPRNLERLARKMPVLIINGKIRAENVYSFYCDDRAAVYAVASQVLDAEPNVVYVSDAATYSAKMKINGFLAACAEHGYDGAPFVLSCASSPLCAKETFADFYRAHPQIRTVITSNDLVASGIIAAAREADLRIPEDLQIIGYNNSVLCECTYPTLTSIDNKVETICAEAIKTLTALFDGEKAQNDHKVHAELKVRSTYIPK